MNAPEIELLEAGASEADMAEPDTREEIRRRILATIRSLHAQAGGLSRVHRTHAALYAQARRAFGSWRGAVAAAGIDYARERDESLRRGLTLRDQRRALWNAVARFLLDQPGADDAALAVARPELAQRVRRCWGGLAAAQAWAAQNRSRQQL